MSLNPKQLFFKKKKVKLPNQDNSISKNSVCEICGISKLLDRAHIFPKRLLLNIQGMEEWLLDYNNKNILILCKNHHALYDRNDLDIDNFVKIYPKIDYVFGYLLENTIFNIEAGGKWSKKHQKSMFGHIMKVMYKYFEPKSLPKWQEKVDKIIFNSV